MIRRDLPALQITAIFFAATCALKQNHGLLMLNDGRFLNAPREKFL